MSRITKHEMRLSENEKFDIDITGKADTAGTAEIAVSLSGYQASTAQTPNRIPVRDGNGLVPGTAPSSRTINGKALNANIVLAAQDIQFSNGQTVQDHLNNPLPHLYTDPSTGRTYKWGVAFHAGQWGIMVEEV